MVKHLADYRYLFFGGGSDAEYQFLKDAYDNGARASDLIALVGVSPGATALTIQEGDASVDTTVNVIDFNATDFDVTESPEDEANIAISAAIARQAALDTTNTNVTNLTTTVSGHTTDIAALQASAGGFGPHWVASATAPLAVRNAITAVGGAVCDGTADEVQVQAALDTYGICVFWGTLTVAATITLATRNILTGIGIGQSRLNGAAGLAAGSFVTTANNAENVYIGNFTISKTSANAAVSGIDINITSTAGFQFGAEGKPVVENMLIDSVYDGLKIRGAASNDSKIYNVTVKRCTHYGFWVDDCPDGNMSYCTAGSITGPGDGTGHGFVFTTNSANWHVNNCKAWYCKGDGWYIRGVRNSFEQIEAQDCSYAGIRFNGYYSSLTNFICDSNSYTSGNTFSKNGVYGGLEIGLTQADTSQGGDNCSIVGGMSYDKNEGGRGYNQKYGVRIKSSVRRLNLVGVDTGDPTDSHKNATAGISFKTAADQTHASNNVASIDHGTRMTSW